MEKITEEVKNYVTRYKATDGETFRTEEECRKWEESAKCRIRSKLMYLIVAKEKDAWELMGGSDDHLITAFKPVTKEDVDTIKQFWLIECPWITDNSRKEFRERNFSIMDNALADKDVLLFGQNCDGDYYFINSRQNIINNLINIDKKEEENA